MILSKFTKGVLVFDFKSLQSQLKMGTPCMA